MQLEFENINMRRMGWGEALFLYDGCAAVAVLSCRIGGSSVFIGRNSGQRDLEGLSWRSAAGWVALWKIAVGSVVEDCGGGFRGRICRRICGRVWLKGSGLSGFQMSLEVALFSGES